MPGFRRNLGKLPPGFVRKKEVPFDHFFYQTFSPLSVNLKKLHFSVNLDEDSELAKEIFNKFFPKLQKKLPSET